MENEVKFLKERITFLEAMLEIDGKALEKSILTNQALMNFLMIYFQK